MMPSFALGALPKPSGDPLLDQLRFMAHLPKQCGGAQTHQYASIYEFVAERGNTAPEIALTIEEQAWFKQVTRGVQYPIKQCFSNSQQFVLNGAELLPEGWTIAYVEGFVAPDRIPMAIHHGWAVLNGKLIDLTLRYHDLKPKRGDRFADRAIGLFPKRQYRGVTFTVQDVQKHVLAHREWGTIIDNWRDGHPLLRGEGSYVRSA